MRRLALIVAACGLLLAPSAALASQPRPSLLALESDLVCVTCHETLDMSTSPLAEQMKSYIRRFIAEGWSKQRIENYFVAQFGEEVLAVPPTHGFNLFAWVIPFAVIGGGLVAVGTGAWVWSRNRSDDDGGGTGVLLSAGGPLLAPALESRIDQELARYDP
jgi:cytochrome c-type biogenesis protein CcmH